MKFYNMFNNAILCVCFLGVGFIQSLFALPIPLTGLKRVRDNSKLDFETIKIFRREFITYNASLPNVTIFATGGTIAGSASSSAQVVGYQAGALGIETLIEAVPELVNISNIAGVQFSNIASGYITPSNLYNLSLEITAELSKDTVQGVVVTHGTDSLEETAFFLDATIKTEKPIVVVGAMRPATALSADGPFNLLESVTLAASEEGKGRGVMVVLNDRIASAYYVTKTNANSLDTFKSYEQGYVGFFYNAKPLFYYPPARATKYQYFDLSNTAIIDLPSVEILYGYQGLNPELLIDAAADGAKGLVIAGMGAGAWTEEGYEAITKVHEEYKIPILASTRTGTGYVGTDDDSADYIGAGVHNPQKARYLLMLALNAGYEEDQIKSLFNY